MMIEVVGDVEESDVYQTISKLLAQAVLTDEAVAALLTNLADHWLFFWLTKDDEWDDLNIKTVVVTDPTTAFMALSIIATYNPDREQWADCFAESVHRYKLSQLPIKGQK
ncbi:hypothetical protein P3T76_014565 [Phytophthora citrophthora]|uniref:Uncharacterized protein n=1 Tax=Phytophthora citrophthora TaxID=4793 RepID=A0AAD9G1E6_9STRA|nr:hypothetical protein P3T76_014565 [Phytophthora citrophthora]